MDISRARCPGCGQSMKITRAYCDACEASLEGEFEVSSLGRLSLEDQLFVVVFLRQHGSIKQMERLFGVSYPTVKNRLNAIVRELDRDFTAPSPSARVLEELARGAISVEEALRRMS
ncbi:MAG: DUF2089 domain-containing protein [Candidatus Eisenbacteria sp.]|nr:DUF2089 domain-containing protein [Candidatus Eisenbacteria bacterium]